MNPVFVVSQAAEEQVNRLCLEAQESMVMGRWMDLASLMLTSADLMFSKVSDKGTVLFSVLNTSLAIVSLYRAGVDRMLCLPKLHCSNT